MALDLFSKVLSQYNSTGQLPTSVTIPWNYKTGRSR
jgi:hypothetical protein